RDKLMESGEAEEIRNRHLEYHVRLAESAESGLYGSTALKWVYRLEAEYDNLRVAIEWGLDKDPVAVLRMAGALPNFWFRRGYENEGIQWIHAALEREKSLPEVMGEAARVRMAILAKSWQAVSLMAFSQGDMLNASAAATTCANYARQLGDKKLLATVLSFEAASKMMSARFEDVDKLMDEVARVVDESNDQFAKGMAYGILGTRLLMTGRDVEKGNQLVAQGLTALKGSENLFGHAMVVFGLGMGARFNGRLEEARERLTPLLSVFREMGDHHRTNMIHSEIAHIERLERNYENAIIMYRRTILEWKRLGHRAAVANQLECFAFIAKAQEQPERAIKLLGAAEALRELIKIDMSQLERVEYEREVADLKANTDEKVFASLWAEGRSVTMGQAVHLALSYWQ
ncbi:MAG: hypothetical protein HYZ22_13190, partial [Chloroflexi bacterium]|nr:hypothetical protein [Chloroflexota bacterium]